MIKLVVTDLDGTLFHTGSTISEKNLKAIHYLKEKGVSFGMASGRGVPVIEEIIKANHISDCVDLIIGFNGVTLGRKGLEAHVEPPYLSRNIMIELVEKFKQKGLAFAVHQGDLLIASGLSNAMEEEKDLNDYKMTIVEDFASILNQDYPKLMFVGEPELLDRLEIEVEALKRQRYHSCRSHQFFLEIVACGVSKGETLAAYCEHMGINAEEVMAMGDNANDYEMVKYAGFGIAMENAVDKLKEAAFYVSGHHMDDGFAEAIYRFVK